MVTIEAKSDWASVLCKDLTFALSSASGAIDGFEAGLLLSSRATDAAGVCPSDVSVTAVETEEGDDDFDHKEERKVEVAEEEEVADGGAAQAEGRDEASVLEPSRDDMLFLCSDDGSFDDRAGRPPVLCCRALRAETELEVAGVW